MSLKSAFELFIEEYPDAKEQEFSGHAIGEFIRKDLPETISLHIDNPRYKIVGSVGKGNWARSPWVAVFDTLVTES